jgi:hypothetical protein
LLLRDKKVVGVFVRFRAPLLGQTASGYINRYTSFIKYYFDNIAYSTNEE